MLQDASVATVAVNARGATMVTRLHDIPYRVEEIAMHGVARRAAAALTLAHLDSPGNNFLPGLDNEEVAEPEVAYGGVAAAIAENVSSYSCRASCTCFWANPRSSAYLDNIIH